MNRVLIVDDQPAFRRQLRRLLTFAGFEVIGEVADIESAERIVRAERPYLVVVDLMLPGTNGLEGTRRLKALRPNLRVILISAYLDHGDDLQSAAVEAGAEIFVPKEDLDLPLVTAWLHRDVAGRKGAT